MISKEKLMIEMQDKAVKNVFTDYNHIELVDMGVDHAVFRLKIHPESKNSFGMVHGGAIYAMADNAAGFAAHTDGRHYVTQSSSMNFFSNQAEGEIRATAYVRHRGRSISLAVVDITGEGGKLIAAGEFSYFCVDKSLLDAKAAKAEEND